MAAGVRRIEAVAGERPKVPELTDAAGGDESQARPTGTNLVQQPEVGAGEGPVAADAGDERPLDAEADEVLGDADRLEEVENP